MKKKFIVFTICIIVSLFVFTACGNTNKKIENKLQENNIKIFFNFSEYGNTYDSTNACFLKNVEFKDSSCYREIPSDDNKVNIYIVNLKDQKELINVSFEGNEIIYDNPELLDKFLSLVGTEKVEFDKYLDYYQKKYVDVKYSELKEKYVQYELTEDEIINEIQQSGKVISKNQENNITISSKTLPALGDVFVFSLENNQVQFLYRNGMISDISIYYISENRIFGIKTEKDDIICTYDLLNKTTDGNNCDKETIDKIEGLYMLYDISLQSMHITQEELFKVIRNYK